MSRTVDQYVAEMQFDNRHFEQNVKTTMTTLEKFKAKLNFQESAKGLENISGSIKKLDFNPLHNGADLAKAKMLALEVAGITALSRITNSAITTGKRLVSSLTIDPIKSGLKEYETQLNAVQTILANTESKGSTIEDVNAALDELNKYADLTIYNFTEMTRNIGTFTAAGVDLETSTSAIKGIANLAAMSGSSSQQASTAMYQLSQALAAGSVKLQDWNSVVNAGMGGQVFQDALKRTARAMGTDVDAIIEKRGSFRESLRDEWITSDVLTETLNQFTMAVVDAEAGTEEYKNQWNELKKSLTDKGYTEAQAEEILTLANTATEAATKVKTFTQLIDVLQEAVGSGWAQTWEILFGDLEQAKELWTPISDFLTGFIGKISDARNKLLSDALSSPLGGFVEKISQLGNVVSTVSEKIKDYNELVDEIIGGKWGNGQSRWDKLAEAGYDWAYAQNKVNEKLGDATRYATDYNETQEKIAEVTEEITDAKLKELDFTDKEIEMYRTLEAEAKASGKSIAELAQEMDDISGRELLITGFKNIGSSIVKIFTAIGNAWRDAFPPMSATTLYKIIKGFQDFTAWLAISDKSAQNLERTFKGIFAILDIVTMVVGGPLSIAFKIVTKILKHAKVDIFALTAIIGDAIVKVRDAIESVLDFGRIFESIEPMLTGAKDALKAWFDGLKDADNIATYIIEGLIKGLMNGIPLIFNIMWEVGKQMILGICEALGIHSPAREMIEVGKHTTQGIVEGIKTGMPKVIETIVKIANAIIGSFKQVANSKDVTNFANSAKEIFEKFKMGAVKYGTPAVNSVAEIIKGGFNVLVNTIKKIDFGLLLSGFVSIRMLNLLKQFSSALSSLASPLEGIGKAAEGAAKKLKAQAFKAKAQAILILAGAVFVLAMALALLASIPQDKLKQAITSIAIIIGLLIALMAATKLLNGVNFKVTFTATALIALCGSLLLIILAMKLLTDMDPDKVTAGLDKVLQLFVALGLLIAVVGAIVKGKTAQNAKQVAKLIKSFGIAILLLTASVKILGGMDPEALEQGGNAILNFVIIIAALMIVMRFLGTKTVGKLSSTLSSVAGAFAIMAIAVAILGTMKPSTLIKGELAVLGFVAIIFVLVGGLKLIGPGDVVKCGATIFAFAGAMVIMALVVRMLGGMSPKQLDNGLQAIIKFATILIAIVAVVSWLGGPEKAGGVALTLLAMSMAIAVLASAMLILGIMKPEMLQRGIMTIGILLLGMTAMVAAARGINEKTYLSIIALVGGIVVLAAAAVVLTLIDPVKLAIATTALVILVSAFSLLVIAAKGMDAGGLLSLIGIAAIVAILAVVMTDLTKLPANDVLLVTSALSIALLSMAGCLLILNNVHGMSLGAFASLAIMVLIIVILKEVITSIGSMSLDTLMPTLTVLGTVLLSLLGAVAAMAILGNFAGLALAGVGAFAVVITALGGLFAALGALNRYFPDLVTLINDGIPILETIGDAIGSFFGNIVSSFMSSITEDLPQMATDLSMFMALLTPFIVGAKLIDTQAMEGVKNLAEMLLILTGTELLDFFASMITGGTSLAEFGAQLVPFGFSLMAFSNVVKDIDGEAVKAASEAGKNLAEMAKALPNDGGLFGKIFGENDMESFAKSLPSFGEAIVGFSNKVAGMKTQNIEDACAAGTSIAEMAKALPNSGGWAASILGDNDMEVFAEKLDPFATAIKKFADNIAGIDKNAANNATTVGKTVAEMAKELPNSGGWITAFTGDNDLSAFASKLIDFGYGVHMFSEYLKISDIEAIGSVSEHIATIAALDTKALEDTKDAIISFATDSINKFSDEFVNAKKTISWAFDTFIAYISSGISDIRLKYASFYDAGVYLVSGFTNGITNNKTLVKNAASKLAEVALEAAREELDEHSPSRKFYQVGDYAGLGFVNALLDSAKSVYYAGREMASNALDGVKSSISSIADAISMDIDSTPVIRPVVDLSGVENGVDSMNNLFTNSPQLAFAGARLASRISLNSNTNQNGVNDVVDAINELKGIVSNNPNNTYNINGITYDDGSNITNAVQELVRAARVERRK